jgi:exopolysaccharide biosynthesis WecB/TagA/CpsF family protein
VLDVEVDRLTSIEALGRIDELVAGAGPAACFFVNAHTLNLAARDPAFREVLATAALVLNDGAGLAIAGRVLGQPFPENLNGSDFMPRVLEHASVRGWRVFLLGGREGVAADAAASLTGLLPALRICGTRAGHFPDPDSASVAAEIRATEPDLLLVAMGNPRQELWLSEWLLATGASVGFGVGGFLDFQSGRVPRAPRWMNRAGLEWVFRLIQEPRRLARRYLVGNPVFLVRLGTDAVRRRRRVV